MGEVPNKARWCLIVLLVFTTATHGSITYYLSNFCGQTFNMADNDLDEMVLELTNSGNYGPSMDCDMTIVTSPDNFLSFAFLDLEMDDCGDSVIIYGNSMTIPDAVTSQLCSKPNSVDTTDGPQAIIRFQSDLNGHKGGFKILITSFYTTVSGTCSSDSFTCDNGRCIYSGLDCNTRDNCGDNSDNIDCDKDEHLWWKILLGVFAVFAICVGIGCFFLIKHLQDKKSQTSRVHTTAPHANAYVQSQPQHMHRASDFSGTWSQLPPVKQTGHNIEMATPPPHFAMAATTTRGKTPSGLYELEDEVPGPAVYFNPSQPDEY